MFSPFSTIFEALSLIVLIKNSVTPAPANVSSVNVVVIGGGVSGLTAAANLRRSRFNVTLLEASSRIGGRTHTLKLDNDHHIELGAEWVHGETGNAVFELLYSFGVLDNATAEDVTEYALNSGSALNTTMSERLSEFLEIIWADPDSWKMKNVNYTNYGVWGEFVLNKYIKDKHLSWNDRERNLALDIAQKYIIGDWSAENWWQVSKREDGEQFIECEGNFAVRWNKSYSYSNLQEYIMTGNITRSGKFDLPDWIHLNSEVAKIKYFPGTPHSSIVRTANGKEYIADHVVFTPSLGVLKAHHQDIFEPSLSERKQLAIRDLGFGCVAKIFLGFSEPWWSPNFSAFLLYDDHDYLHGDESLQWWRPNITKDELLKEVEGLPLWCRGMTAVAAIDSGSAPSYLRVWVTSLPAKLIDEFDPEYLQTSVMRTIRKSFSEKFPNIPEPFRLHKSSWWSNPHVRGTYSFRTPASDENDVWARDLAKPIYHLETMKPVICFAGEATNTYHFATVHGAYETGIREFERIKSFYEA